MAIQADRIEVGLKIIIITNILIFLFTPFIAYSASASASASSDGGASASAVASSGDSGAYASTSAGGSSAYAGDPSYQQNYMAAPIRQAPSYNYQNSYKSYPKITPKKQNSKQQMADKSKTSPAANKAQSQNPTPIYQVAKGDHINQTIQLPPSGGAGAGQEGQKKQSTGKSFLQKLIPTVLEKLLFKSKLGFSMLRLTDYLDVSK